MKKLPWVNRTFNFCFCDYFGVFQRKTKYGLTGHLRANVANLELTSRNVQRRVRYPIPIIQLKHRATEKETEREEREREISMS